MRSFVLLSVVMALLPASLAQICSYCPVTACQPYLSAVVDIGLPAPSNQAAAAMCNMLNQRLTNWIGTSDNATCAANVAGLACGAISYANQTMNNCNISSIPTNNNFTQGFTGMCNAQADCLSQVVESTLQAEQACNSIENFFGAVVMLPQPSTGCKQCRISACDGALPANVSVWIGSETGITGDTCTALQSFTSAVLNSTVSSATKPAAQRAFCNTLYATGMGVNETVCSMGMFDSTWDSITFDQVSPNEDWQVYCPTFLSSTFAQPMASNLLAAGYCRSPSIGFRQYVAGVPSSTGSGNPGSSSGPNAASVVGPTAVALLVAIAAMLL